MSSCESRETRKMIEAFKGGENEAVLTVTNAILKVAGLLSRSISETFNIPQEDLIQEAYIYAFKSLHKADLTRSLYNKSLYSVLTSNLRRFMLSYAAKYYGILVIDAKDYYKIIRSCDERERCNYEFLIEMVASKINYQSFDAFDEGDLIAEDIDTVIEITSRSVHTLNFQTTL